MGHKHTREEILDAAVVSAFETGLSQLSYGRVAKHAGTSDRIVVYYFPSKEDLVTSVLVSLGTQLQGTLAPAFPTPATDHVALIRTAWPILATPQADPVFALFFEANGLAAAGREPYGTVVRELVESWITWMAALIEGTPAERRTEAESALAVIDGLLLLRQLAGSRAANRAARRVTADRAP